MSKWGSDDLAKFYSILTAVLQYFIPLTVIAVTYIGMLIVIKGKARVGIIDSDGKVENPTTSAKDAKIRKNILKTLALVSICYIICLGPNQMYFFLLNFYDWSYGTTIFYDFSVYMVFINCVVNPFCYGAQYKEFRGQARKLFCKMRSGEAEETSIHTSNSTHTT